MRYYLGSINIGILVLKTNLLHSSTMVILGVYVDYAGIYHVRPIYVIIVFYPLFSVLLGILISLLSIKPNKYDS